MAKTSSMYIRIDPEVKADVERIYSKYGMSITDAVNVFLYQSRNVGGLPFNLRPAKPKVSPANIKNALQKSAKRTPAIETDDDPDLEGALNKYANPALIPFEKNAWKEAAMKKHGPA
jgi:addiction module RelB/DinJ family antitoxin